MIVGVKDYCWAVFLFTGLVVSLPAMAQFSMEPAPREIPPADVSEPDKPYVVPLVVQHPHYHYVTHQRRKSLDLGNRRHVLRTARSH
jgi:hypothetical protein